MKPNLEYIKPQPPLQELSLKTKLQLSTQPQILKFNLKYMVTPLKLNLLR